MGGFTKLSLTLAVLLLLAAPVLADGGHSIPWSLDDCDYVIAFAFLPGALLQPHLPEGWLAPPASQVGFEMERCRSGTGLVGPVADMEYATIWASVVPPPALRVAGFGFYSINLDSLVPDDDRLALLREHGITSVHDGDVTYERLGLDGAAGMLIARTTYDDEGGFEVRTGSEEIRDGSTGGGVFVSYNFGDGVVSRWRTAWDAPLVRIYPAVVTLAPDSTAADVFGTTTVPAYAWVGTWSYTPGRIEFPLGLR